MPPPSPSRSPLRALAISSGTAMVYALWAAAANSAHGLSLALRSAATQCFITFSLTLIMTLVVERLHRVGTTPVRRVAAATLGALATTCAVSLTLHTLSGTPEILRTMLPPMSIGAVYCFASALRLERLREGPPVALRSIDPAVPAATPYPRAERRPCSPPPPCSRGGAAGEQAGRGRPGRLL